VLAEILRQGLPHPTAQHTITVDDGKHRIRFDFAWPDRYVGLEVDHPFWHAGVEQTHSDKWRDRKAGVEGWFTSRVTSLDVDGGLKTAIADVNELLGTADRKRRLAAQVAGERGWDPLTVSQWLVVADTRTNRRRVDAHMTVIRNAFPDGTWAMRRWLQRPRDTIAAMTVWATPR